MPKKIDATWKSPIGKKQIEMWKKENIGKPVDTRNNYEKLMDEKAGIKTFNDVVNNLAKTYAITSTMMEGITSGLSIATGGLMKFGFGKLGSAFVSSKVGQQAIANSMYQKLSKPLMHASLLSKEMAQEGLTEYYQ